MGDHHYQYTDGLALARLSSFREENDIDEMMSSIQTHLIHAHVSFSYFHVFQYVILAYILTVVPNNYDQQSIKMKLFFLYKNTFRQHHAQLLFVHIRSLGFSKNESNIHKISIINDYYPFLCILLIQFFNPFGYSIVSLNHKDNM